MPILIAAAGYCLVRAGRMIALVVRSIEFVEDLCRVISVPYSDILLGLGVETAIRKRSHRGIRNGLS